MKWWVLFLRVTIDTGEMSGENDGQVQLFCLSISQENEKQQTRK
jgi:hypothetical protein